MVLQTNDKRVGDWQLKYVLDLQSFAVIKLPEDGTLVPKHVAAGT
jgi:hypothetical protein